MACVLCDGPDPPAPCPWCEATAADTAAAKDRLIEHLAARCHEQAELLGRRAERPVLTETDYPLEG